MSPRSDGKRRQFGRSRKTVLVHGEKFRVSYTMSKVLVHEPPSALKRHHSIQRDSIDDTTITDPYLAKVHGPYTMGFDYSKFLPKKRGGRWVPGKWMPLITKSEMSMCAKGYHACTFEYTGKWKDRSGGKGYGSKIWLVEGVGPILRNPKSQSPLKAEITYAYYFWDADKRRKVTTKRPNPKVSWAKSEGGYAYGRTATKYAFRSIRFLRPITLRAKPKPRAKKAA